jgi:hypothetical protein
VACASNQCWNGSSCIARVCSNNVRKETVNGRTITYNFLGCKWVDSLTVKVDGNFKYDGSLLEQAEIYNP